MTITAIVADDHLMFRTLLSGALKAQGIEVKAEASCGHTAVKLALEYKPDLMLIDLRMPPGMSGLKAAHMIKGSLPQTKLIACTSVDEVSIVSSVINAGFDGLVSKGSSVHALEEAITRVLQGSIYYQPGIFSESIHKPDLTSGELDVLTLAAEGRNKEQISDQLKLSMDTVDEHYAQLSKKLKARTDAHLGVIGSVILS